MGKLKILIYVFVLTIFFFTSFIESGQVKKVHNTLDEIKACKGKIKLTLVKEWGGEKTTDEAQYFNMPYDIEIDSLGQVYILDSGNNQIQVFDSLGKHKRTIGRKGGGPGDFSRPMDLAIDNQNNLLVSDYQNRRIQILDSAGEYIKGFKTDEGFASSIEVNKKNELIMYNYFKAVKSLFYLFVYDYDGVLRREIVKRRQGKDVNAWTLESIYFSLDNQNNLYTAYYCSPLLEVYSKKGELKKVITFEVPFDVPEIQLVVSGNDRKIIAERVSFGLDVDDSCRIYVVTATRPKTEKEKRMVSFIGSRSRDGTQHRGIVVKDYDSKITDLYRLLVFDSSGKIIATKRLNHFCDKIKVHKDRLFIIDSYLEMTIYQYKIRFLK